MIYVDTRRHFWRSAKTFPRFFGTAILVALALVAPHAAALLLVLKLAWEARTFFDGSGSAKLQRGPLARVSWTRDLLGLVSLITLVVSPGPWALVPLIGGELAERLLFFRAIDAPKMPGMPA